MQQKEIALQSIALFGELYWWGGFFNTAGFFPNHEINFTQPSLKFVYPIHTIKMGKKRTANARTKDDELKHTSVFNQLNGLDEIDSVLPEDIPRKFSQVAEAEESEGLPIIVNGKVKHVKRQKTGSSSASGNGDEDNDDEDEDDEEGGNSQKTTEPEEDEYVEISGRELKERIALFADLITGEPEEHLNKLRELLKMSEKTKKTVNRQVLLVSLLAIFKSIIPGYNIKELTEQQLKEKVSKEVKQVRDYEQGLLASYKRFVKLIHHSFRQSKLTEDETVKETRSVANKRILATTAVEIACELIESLPHFNYRHELVIMITERLASKRIDASFNRCLECLTSVFEQDEEGQVSFEAVQAICKMVKARRYKVDSRVVGVLVHLRLLTELKGRADLEKLEREKPQSIESQLHLKRRDRVHLTKNQRKARKEQKEIDEQMRKAELGISAKVRERLQAQTLKLVFVLYMNVLKLRARTLLGVTLEGLAKFAHLVNADLYGDLLEVLREILTTEGVGSGKSTRQSLLCILTAFQLLRGQGASLEKSTDLGFFIDELYKTLNEMALSASIETSHRSLQSSHKGKFTSETDMLVSCLEFLFMRKRAVSKVRLLAFTKRLAECSLQFPERSSMIALKALREMVKQNPEAAALLQIHDRVGRGSYNFEAEVPEQANAEVSTLWEIALLKQHYDPRVQTAAKEVRGDKR